MAEAGGPAALAGAMIKPLDGDGGIFSAEQLEEAIRPDDRYMPRSRLVSVEQTTNMGGGRVWPLEAVRSVLEVARAHGLRAHLDGARLMNAVVASGVPAADYACGFDTAWIDFSKGLGAPVGAVLCALARADRRGLALEADDGRRPAPGGHRGRRLHRTRSTTTSSGWPRTTRTRACSRTGCASSAWTCCRRRPTS